MKTLSILFMFLCSLFCFSQGKCIPFQIIESGDSKKGILLDYEIRGEKMRLFYDTGIIGNGLSYDKAKKIGLILSKDSICAETLARGKLILKRTENFYFDPIFGLFATASSQQTLFSFLSVPIDGYVGYTFLQDTKCLEIDFQKKRLCFTDTLPSFYVDNSYVHKIALNRSDSIYETRSSKILGTKNCIQGTITLSDSIKIQTNFELDLGTQEYMDMYMFDSLLFDKIVKYKEEISLKHGADYPTVQLEIPGLAIDTLMTNIKTYTYFEESNLYKDGFGSAPIGGYLGFNFFLQYDKILFDWKNRLAYFYKE